MSSKKIILSKILEKKDKNLNQENFLFSGSKDDNKSADKERDEREGQLLVDVYESNDKIIIKSIVAGVDLKDLDISLHNDIITIRGKRVNLEKDQITEYFREECYWGKFSRSIILPFKIDENNQKATLHNGILTIVVFKVKDSFGSFKIKVKEI